MEESKGKKRGHVVAVPFPAQGHLTPLLKLSRLIAADGVRFTFVNTHFIHRKIGRDRHHQELVDDADNLVLTSISDGLAVDDDRNDGFKLWESLNSTMAGYLTELIENINNSSNCDEMISCIIVDDGFWRLLKIWELNVSVLPLALLLPNSLAMILQSPDLIEKGDLDLNGNLKRL